ncbi:phosphoglycerate mutase [Aspergillus carlsbadensis]|nr:phosphoglycerate mutase [Aspergillus carlsbadensis]
MSNQDAATPRVFLVRHGRFQATHTPLNKPPLTTRFPETGETEWSKTGQYTGTTDLDLTERGMSQVSSAAATLVGPRKLLDPAQLAHVFVSPRLRAQTTLNLLLGRFTVGKVICTDDIAEWDYGCYEGLTEREIRDRRKGQGLDVEEDWSVWRDGCEGGESSEQVTARLDRIISRIKDIQKPYMKGVGPANILLVAHGLILRCLVKRWLGFPIDFNLLMIFDPGAIAVLSYKNNDITKPAFHVGVAVPPSEEDRDNGALDVAAATAMEQ